MMAHRIESSSAQQCTSQQCAARRQMCALDRARRAGASRRVSSCACVPAGAHADATHRTAGLQALTSRNAGGLGSREAIDPLGMWPATEHATQQEAGIAAAMSRFVDGLFLEESSRLGASPRVFVQCCFPEITN